MKRSKRNNTFNSLLILVLSISLLSCDDIIQEDITNDTVIIITPTEGQTLTTNVVPFQWNYLDGADQYQVQVSNSTNLIVIDSVVNSTTLNHPLVPGNYIWKVKGINSAYHSNYTIPVSFAVNASDDLITQTMVLNTPSDNIYINASSNINTTWTAITAATSYTFELDKNVNGAVTTLITVPNITGTSYSISSSQFSNDAAYIWKVKAVNSNNTTETLYKSRTIHFDSQVPGVPSLTSPVDNHTTTETTINFEWSNPTDTGIVQSPITSILEIATDINFTTAVQSFDINGTSKSHTLTTGTYYWRVKNKDAATNVGGYSTPRKLTIN